MSEVMHREQVMQGEDVLPGEQASLKAGSVSGLEVLAQSVSEIAPSAVVGAVVALVVQATGPASWVTWVVGVVVLLVVAGVLTLLTARYGSPGGLYALATRAAGSRIGYLAAWMAFVCYVGGAVAVVFQISAFATGFLNLPAIGFPYTPLTTFLVAVVGVSGGAWCSYVNAQASARTMLITESISMLLITVLMVLVLITHHGSIVNSQEFKGFSAHDVLLGIPLVLFAFAGFESSTAFAREAKNPKRAITTALVGSVAIASVFFVFCSYVMVLAFHGSHYDIASSNNLLATISKIVGASWYGYVVDVGVILSMFAVIIALINTSSRLLFTLAKERALTAQFARAHPTRGTPATAIGFVWALCLAGAAIVALTQSNVENAFGNMGTLSGDAQGILYLLALIAVVVWLARRRTEITHRWVQAVIVALLATGAIGYLLYKSFVPVPPSPTNVYVYILWGVFALAVVLLGVIELSGGKQLRELGSSVVAYEPDHPGDPDRTGA
ncbi:MAG: APC family permease [Solirubrobacteraceae bacterium]